MDPRPEYRAVGGRPNEDLERETAGRGPGPGRQRAAGPSSGSEVPRPPVEVPRLRQAAGRGGRRDAGRDRGHGVPSLEVDPGARLESPWTSLRAGALLDGHQGTAPCTPAAALREECPSAKGGGLARALSNLRSGRPSRSGRSRGAGARGCGVRSTSAPRARSSRSRPGCAGGRRAGAARRSARGGRSGCAAFAFRGLRAWRRDRAVRCGNAPRSAGLQSVASKSARRSPPTLRQPPSPSRETQKPNESADTRRCGCGPCPSRATSDFATATRARLLASSPASALSYQAAP